MNYKDNKMSNNEKAVKPAYESVSCSVTEVETQGVLCVSSIGGSLNGGLNSYNGGAL